MNDNEILEAIAKFLKEKVSAKIKFKKVPKKNLVEGSYELVNPAVYIGWIPQKNFLNEYGYEVPSFIVMLDEGNDDYTEATLAIRIKVVTYDPGTIETTGAITPNVEGYKDLLNAITRIRIVISENPIISEKVSINKPIQWDMDEEQGYPFWSANVKFNVSIEPIQNIDTFL